MEDLERVHVQALVIAVDKLVEHIGKMDEQMIGSPLPVVSVPGLEACRIMAFENRLPLPGENF